MPALLLLGVTGVVLLNSKVALPFNKILIILKFSALAVFILVGMFHINPSNWTPFAPYGWGQVLGGILGL